MPVTAERWFRLYPERHLGVCAYYQRLQHCPSCRPLVVLYFASYAVDLGFILPRVFTSNEKQPSNSRCIKMMYEGNKCCSIYSWKYMYCTCLLSWNQVSVVLVSGSLVVLPIIPILGLSTKLAAWKLAALCANIHSRMLLIFIVFLVFTALSTNHKTHNRSKPFLAI